MSVEFEIINTPDGQMIGGLDAETAKGESPAGRGVRVYVLVDDLEATLRRVAAGGGEVLQERTLISDDDGRFATFADPIGLRVGLCTGTAAV